MLDPYLYFEREIPEMHEVESHHNRRSIPAIRPIQRTLLNVSIAVAILLCPAAVHGQGRVDSSTASLSSRTREVVDQLGRLRSLEANGWKYHDGDLPHGEEPNLDDSSWQTTNRLNKASKGVIWLRRWFEMPKDLNGYDLAGTRIWLQFRVDGHGPLTEIFYFNGRRVALGEGLEPVVLFDRAKPGERVLVSVKLLETAQLKDFSGASAIVEYSSTRPDPTMLYQELLSLHVLAPTLGADAEAAAKAVDAAAAAVDRDALTKSDSAAFDASLRRGESILAPLRPALRRLTVQSNGPVSYRCRVALAVDRHGGCCAPHVCDLAPTHERIPAVHVQPVHIGLQRMDRREVSRHSRRHSEAGSGGTMGDGRRHVGRTGLQCSGRRIAGAPATRRQAIHPAALWGRCAHRMEPRLVRFRLAASADLQEERRRLFRDDEDELERDPQAPAQAVLVAGSRRQPGSRLLPQRSRRRHQPGRHRRRSQRGHEAQSRFRRDYAHLRYRRSWRRSHTRLAGYGPTLGQA